MGAKKPVKKGEQAPLVTRLVLAAVVFAVLVGLACAIGLASHYLAWTEQPVLRNGDSVRLVIAQGTSWSQVVERLERADLVRRPLYFEIWARRKGLPERVRAGNYQLDGPMSLEELAAALQRGGAVDEVVVTLPEGLTIFAIADRVEASGLVSRADFLEAARDPVAMAEAGIDGESFEGYLFPDTYRFRKDTSAAEIVSRLHARFKEVWDEVTTEAADSMTVVQSEFDFDRHDFVTLASIVERESSSAEERGLIARVFFNRLERKMKLQTDPTCVYGEETYKEVPSPKYCKDPLNRYSTYVIEGLPPGPIANPGRGSLQAVVAPAEGEEERQFLFFVARRDGSHTHYFSKTYAEHRRAVRRFLKKRR